MWVFTKVGFYSVTLVKGRYNPRTKSYTGFPDRVQVRARVGDDLVNLRQQYCPDLSATVESEDTDYRYRAFCTKNQWAAAARKIALDIDYTNFKDAVTHHQGKRRHDVYMRVWSALLELQPTRWSSKGKGSRGRRAGEQTFSNFQCLRSLLDGFDDPEEDFPSLRSEGQDEMDDAVDALQDAMDRYCAGQESGNIPDSVTFEDWMMDQ